MNDYDSTIFIISILLLLVTCALLYFMTDSDIESYNLPTSFRKTDNTLISKSPSRAWDENNDSPELSKTIQKIAEGKIHNQCIDIKSEDLGEDFEDSPWIPPSIEKAILFRKEILFKSGREKIQNVKLTKEIEYGPGLVLYFEFMKSMAILFFILSILSIPILLFSYLGSKVPTLDRDFIGLYRFTLGNIGSNLHDASMFQSSRCTNKSYLSSECIRIFNVEVLLTQVADIITAFEFLQIIAYYLTIIHLSRTISRLTLLAEKHNASISDYSVMVTGLPKDTNIEMLIRHFSQLYQLKSYDWRQRPPLAGAEMTTHIENSNNILFRDTWIADIYIYRKISYLLKTYMHEEKLLKQLYHYRACMKMYSSSTPHKNGPNIRKYESAKRRMLSIAAQIDKTVIPVLSRFRNFQQNSSTKSTKIFPSVSGKMSPVAAGAGGSSTSSISRIFGISMGFSNRNIIQQYNGVSRSSLGLTTASPKTSKQKSALSNLSAALEDSDTIAAFVTFNYSESMARCLEDYELYSQFPWSLLYPSQMKFEGRRLQVTRAPEPDEIQWTNLETPLWKKLFIRSFNIIVGLLVFALGYLVLLQAKSFRSQLLTIVPDSNLCTREIPALYMHSYMVPNNIQPLRLSNLDITCHKILPGSFYLVDTINGNVSRMIAPFHIKACSAVTSAGNSSNQYKSFDVCPSANRTTECPCMSLTSRTACNTLACSGSNYAKNGTCSQFQANAVAQCYCRNVLVSMVKVLLSALDLTSLMNILNPNNANAANGLDVCSQHWSLYTSSVAYIFLAALVTALLNMFIRNFYIFTTPLQYHTTSNSERLSVVRSIFVSVFINMAVIVTLVFGNSSAVPTAVKSIAILQGIFADFSTAWYGQVGSYLVLTLVLSAFQPFMYPLLDYCILKPVNWFRLISQLQRKTNTSNFAMQYDVNISTVGPLFNSTSNTGFLLAFVFFCMTFAPGIPILMPLTSAIFLCFYYLEKLLLCRYYQCPKFMDEKVMREVCKLLPYAAMIRLFVAIWMFGNNDVIPSVIANLRILPGYYSANPEEAEILYLKYLNDNKNNGSIGFYLISRVVRENVMPLFILLVLICIVFIIRKLWRMLPIYWAMAFLESVTKFATKCCRSRGHKTGDTDEEVDADGYIRVPQLLKLKDVRRLEMAPYTGIYFKYLPEANKKTSFFRRLFCIKQPNILLTQKEEEQGWSIGQYSSWTVKQKLWLQSQKVEFGARTKNTEKRTYEVVRDNGCDNYALDRNPTYRAAFAQLKAGIINYSLDVNSPGGPEKFSLVENYKFRMLQTNLSMEVIDLANPTSTFPAGPASPDRTTLTSMKSMYGSKKDLTSAYSSNSSKVVIPGRGAVDIASIVRAKQAAKIVSQKMKQTTNVRAYIESDNDDDEEEKESDNVVRSFADDSDAGGLV